MLHSRMGFPLFGVNRRMLFLVLHAAGLSEVSSSAEANEVMWDVMCIWHTRLISSYCLADNAKPCSCVSYWLCTTRGL